MSNYKYGSWYLKLFDDNQRNLILKAFVPHTISLSFLIREHFVNDIFQEIPGEWVVLDDLSNENWELMQIIPRQTDWIGIFRKNCNEIPEKKEESKNNEIIIQNNNEFNQRVIEILEKTINYNENKCLKCINSPSLEKIQVSKQINTDLISILQDCNDIITENKQNLVTEMEILKCLKKTNL